MANGDVTRFLTDENVPVAWANVINRLSEIDELRINWSATSVYQIDRSGIPDIDQLIFARTNDMILLTCDQFRGQDGLALRAELQTNGGKIIRVAGGPQQTPHEAIAKLLICFNQWSARLAKEDGVAIITGTSSKWEFRTPAEFAARLTRTDAQQFSGYEAAEPTHRNRPIEPDIPDGQLPFP